MSERGLTPIKPIRQKIPTMTDEEEILWIGSPTSRSMYGRYILSLSILGVYLIFWWANVIDRPSGEGQLAFILKSVHLAADLSGVFGLFLSLTIVAKTIHFHNGPTSGKWTILWIMLAASLPMIWTGLTFGLDVAGIFNSEETTLPEFTPGYYFLLAFIMSGVIFALSIFYQRSFTYAITDKRIHLIKQFLYVDASSQSINYDRIENLIVDTTIMSRLLRYGSIQILTASGLNIGSDSTSISAGVTGDAIPSETKSGIGSLTSKLGLLISFKRNRPKAINTPETCIYGIHSPERIHLLINHASDKFREMQSE